MSKSLNKTRILQIGRELESRLSVFFCDKSYTTSCGKHWRDRSKTPQEVATDSIKVKLTRACKPKWSSGGVVRFDFDVISEQPSHVFAGFNLCRGAEVGSHHSITEFMFSAFKGSTLVNIAVDFHNEPCLWFVFKDALTSVYYHVYLYPRFGYREYPDAELIRN
jgi:hypothetical protein